MGELEIVAPKAAKKGKLKDSIVKPARELKLDLACGQTSVEGFEGVDLNAPNAKHRVDLMKFPWPWKSNTVDEINCSHFIEHIHAREVEERDLVDGAASAKSFLGQDMLFAFFDECWRILKSGGTIKVVCPSVRSERAFWDPTHRRFISQVTFSYLAEPWRKANKLDHYRVKCNFDGPVGFSYTGKYAERAPDVQQRVFEESWNVMLDYMATLKAIK